MEIVEARGDPGITESSYPPAGGIRSTRHTMAGAFLFREVDEGIAQVGLAIEVDGQVEEVILPKLTSQDSKDAQGYPRCGQKQKTYNKSPNEPI